MITHTKAYGIYYWDTFDNGTELVAEAVTLEEAERIVREKYNTCLRYDGADRVDIVNEHGVVEKAFKVG